MKWLNDYARDSAIIYAEALIEACGKTKVPDPVRALTDADDFPRLRKISEVEYAIGWLNGCAECHGVTVTALWAQIIAGMSQLQRNSMRSHLAKAHRPITKAHRHA